MSAPSIPPLVSLSGTRGGRSGMHRTGRGRDGPSAGPDSAIQGTDNDAAVSRLSAVQLGYMEDPYARYFVRDEPGEPPRRRLPIINRGSYTRTAALDTLVDTFLSGEGTRQIVSLGAGTDTRPFRLFSRSNRQGLIYHELDFDVVTKKKLYTVQTTSELSGILSHAIPTQEDFTSWQSRPSTGGEYRCHGMDLRQFADKRTAPHIAGLRTDVPTLVLSECCLCYMSQGEADAVLGYFTSRVNDVATVLYEPIRPDDSFGRVMVSNLAARRIRMPTLDVYREPADQEQRLRTAGFTAARGMTVGDIWREWVRPDERDRLDALEGLDEVEEWELLAAHYIVAWGSRGAGFAAWERL